MRKWKWKNLILPFFGSTVDFLKNQSPFTQMFGNFITNLQKGGKRRKLCKILTFFLASQCRLSGVVTSKVSEFQNCCQIFPKCEWYFQKKTTNIWKNWLFIKMNRLLKDWITLWNHKRYETSRKVQFYHFKRLKWNHYIVY